MELELLSVTIWDFKEYRGKHKLDIADLGFGVHFVCGKNLVDKGLGSNGASKSTIFDAITWCLYGATIKGLKGPDVRTWGKDTHATVKLWVRVGDNEHSIIRSTKTNGLELDNKQTTQDAIDRLIRLPQALWGHTVLLGQGEDLFLDLKPAAKMSVLSEALSLDKWEERSKRAKQHADGYGVNEIEMNAQLRSLESTREQINGSIETIRAKSSDWESERALRVDRRDGEIKRLTAACERVDKERGVFDLKYDSTETELRASEKQLSTLMSETAELKGKEAAAAATASALRAQVRELEKSLEEKATVCPTCGQSLKGQAAIREHHDVVKGRLVEAQSKLRKSLAALEDCEKACSAMREKANKVRKEVSQFLDKSNNAQDGLTRKTRELADLKGELKALRNQEQEQGENPFDDMLVRARKQLKATKGLIAESEKLLVIIGRKQVRASYWVKGFKQVRLYLLSEALDELEGVTAALLSAVGLEAWSIRYEIERETKAGAISSGLSVSILKPNMTKAVKWESWSGGEAQRLRLVASMALSEMLLRRAGIECDTIILDEPTQHLSPEGVRDTVDLLIERASNMQIFYIDHTAQQSKRFASTIMVTKRETGASFNVT